MKTFLAITISTLLITACGGSSNNDSTPLDASGDMPMADVPIADGPNPMGGVNTTSGGDMVGGNADSGIDTDMAGGNTDPPVVPTTGMGDPSSVGSALEDNANALVIALAGYSAEDSVPRIRALGDTVIDTALGTRSLPDLFLELFNVTNEIPDFPLATVVEYDCALGGSLVKEAASYEDVLIPESVPQNTTERAYGWEALRFSECRVMDAGRERVANGALEVSTTNLINADGTVTEGNRFVFRDLEVVVNDSVADGDRLFVSGAFDTVESDSGSPTYREETRDGVLDYQSKVGDVTEELELANLRLRLTSEAPYSTYELEASGTVTNAATGGIPVVIETVAKLSRTRRADGVDDGELSPITLNPVGPFVGELSLRSEDGSMLSVTARDTDTESLFIDQTYVGADGTTHTRENVPFAVLTLVSSDAALAN